eukprot:CAMPEP_0114238642 /NCGR_PEP_ID=MMETSP0058-20121206/8030_1 /TAXON_ID=36894 /ORGANISM="Pyramimonas parkeae, CCMP726" /LENGTH=384 /DNA_ID=CAMNT_0001350759 /DNA_START=96 /DNA_END=1250 /DNA_ORIENTATION=+
MRRACLDTRLLITRVAPVIGSAVHSGRQTAAVCGLWSQNEGDDFLYTMGLRSRWGMDARGFSASASTEDNNDVKGSQSVETKPEQGSAAEATALETSGGSDAAVESVDPKFFHVTSKGRKIRKRVPRKLRPSYADTLGKDAQTWPSAEELLGRDFGPVYNAQALVNEQFEEKLEDSPFYKLDVEELMESIKDDVGHKSQKECGWCGKPPSQVATHDGEEELCACHACLEKEQDACHCDLSFLIWQVNMVLAPGPDAYHPLNRKVKLSMDVVEMQQKLRLTDDQLERVLLLAGSRFQAQQTCTPEQPAGVLVFVTRKYENRDDARRFLLDQFKGLLDEAMKVGTASDSIAACPDYDKWKAKAADDLEMFNQRLAYLKERTQALES